MAACGTPQTTSAGTDVMRKPIVDNKKTDFSMRLLGTGLRQGDPKQNLVLSPFSAGVALSLLLDGAAGKTQSALFETLSYATYAGTEIYTDSLNRRAPEK